MPGNSAGEGWELIVTPWHLDEHIPGFPLPAGAAELTRPSLPAGPQTGRMIRLYEAVADVVARAARPLLLSGDCTTALGAVAGLQRRHGDAAVVWLDGHGDFNTPATTITGYLGGMPLAMLTGRAPELISDPWGCGRSLTATSCWSTPETSTPPNATPSLPAASAACAPNRVRSVPCSPGSAEACLPARRRRHHRQRPAIRPAGPRRPGP